jgi:hypothetical protein
MPSACVILYMVEIDGLASPRSICEMKLRVTHC